VVTIHVVVKIAIVTKKTLIKRASHNDETFCCSNKVIFSINDKNFSYHLKEKSDRNSAYIKN